MRHPPNHLFCIDLLNFHKIIIFIRIQFLFAYILKSLNIFLNVIYLLFKIYFILKLFYKTKRSLIGSILIKLFYLFWGGRY